MVQPWLFPCTLLFFLFSSSYVMALSEPSPFLMEIQQAHVAASSKAKVVKAIVATVTTTLVIALIVFFFFFRKIGRWRWWLRGKYKSSFRREAMVIPDEFMKYGEKVKGLVVEENGRDALRMIKLDDLRLKNEFPKVMFNPSYEEDEGEKKMDNTRTTLKPPPPPPSITPPAAPPSRPVASISFPVLKPPTTPRADSDHSMVWDQIKDGSLRFDDELIETLFIYTTANRKSPDGNNISSTSTGSGNTTTAKTFIIEPRKSQSSVIVLKSLGISKTEIIGALIEGQGLGAEVLEKLTKIAPTHEEEAKILHFNCNPMRRPDTFFYDVPKVIPSTFVYIKPMLFRSNYDSELLSLKECLQTLELASNEL
ncbi:Two-component response regulator ARR5 [Hibiscus syriacus]|uniref:Two-component response regulator ARR5 n=1 Tax=Hibiscus syriacus TaxID=106335 RepID=A0A6A3BXI9_HIBSY|nr:Two-component response regulator ARR5 [Hibiscus syriacus]